MTLKLSHLSSYEWTGQFWFPDEEESIFSGKLKYTPNVGIELELIITGIAAQRREESYTKKIMYCVVQGEKSLRLTLVDVMISISSRQWGSSVLVSFKGFATALVGGEINTAEFDKISVQYPKDIENIFFRPTTYEIDTLSFHERSPTIIKNNVTVSINIDSTGTPLSSGKEIDTIFFAYKDDKEGLRKLQKYVDRMIKNKSLSVYKRNDFSAAFEFSTKKTTLKILLLKERIWRSFWEMIIDKQTAPTFLSVSVWHRTNDNKKYRSNYPVLYSYYRTESSKSYTAAFFHLPINITKFGDALLGLKILNTPLKKWYEYSANPKWSEILLTINNLISNQSELVTASIFSSLVASSKTLLIQIKEDAYINNMIERLDMEQKMELGRLTHEIPFLKNSRDKDLGVRINSIRNAIEHPHGDSNPEKNKIIEICWEKIISQPFVLQKIYALLAGSFIKTFLMHMNIVEQEALDSYISQFIKNRSSFSAIEFIDNTTKN